MDTYGEELAHTEKSHELLCTSWRYRKTSGIIHSYSEGLRNRGADGTNPSLRAREGEVRCPSSSQ